MTLAVILFVSIFCVSARPPVAASPQSAEQSAPAGKPASTSGTQDSSSPAQSSSSSSATKSTSPTTQTPSGQKPPAAPRPHHKKKRIASNCVPASAAGTSPATSGSTSSNPAPGAAPAGTTPAPQPASAPTVCPPPKVIVRQGGTSEPSIQLSGGAAGDQAAQQRHTANQMLGATEANLKKIAGTQLTANQQEMVNQVHQFMDQSKTAVAAGDFERGRTLAWKAQLLSEELVNPQK
jgi:hypothetical protein